MAKKAQTTSKMTSEKLNPADDTRRNRLKTRRDIAALEARMKVLELDVWRELEHQDTLRRAQPNLEARVTALEEWRGRGNVRDNPEPERWQGTIVRTGAAGAEEVIK